MEEKKKSRKNYTPEFKLEAVARCKKMGTTRASEELGVCQATLNRWKKELSEEKPQVDSDKASYKELEKENRRLKRELGYMEEINRVLKKSTAIFSSSQMGGLK